MLKPTQLYPRVFTINIKILVVNIYLTNIFTQNGIQINLNKAVHKYEELEPTPLPMDAFSPKPWT